MPKKSGYDPFREDATEQPSSAGSSGALLASSQPEEPTHGGIAMPKEISQADARRWRSLAKKSVPIAVRLLSEIRSDGWETVEGYVPIVRKFETELAYLKGRGDR